MTISIKEFTTCAVADDGSQISLGLVDSFGKHMTLMMSPGQLSSFIMTSSTLIERAVQRAFKDESLRYTHPLGGWRLECSSEQHKALLTLSTTDGFRVCFSLYDSEQAQLGEALIEQKSMVSQSVN